MCTCEALSGFHIYLRSFEGPPPAPPILTLVFLSLTSSTPSISPWPRTSPMMSCLACSPKGKYSSQAVKLAWGHALPWGSPLRAGWLSAHCPCICAPLPQSKPLKQDGRGLGKVRGRATHLQRPQLGQQVVAYFGAVLLPLLRVHHTQHRPPPRAAHGVSSVAAQQVAACVRVRKQRQVQQCSKRLRAAGASVPCAEAGKQRRKLTC